jgi:hypothetical protein
MAKYGRGIMGAFSGMIGPVIGSSWKGKPYMRSRSGPRKKPPSPAQQEHEAKFALVANFLLSMRSVLRIGFPGKASHMSGYNAALRHTFHQAVTGEYPDFQINYSKVLISDGDLFGTDRYSVHAGQGNIIFSWNDNSGNRQAKPDDRVVLVVYCEEKQASHCYTLHLRNAGTGTVSVQDFTGKVVQTYLSFISADGRRAAISLYTGQLVVI